MLGQEVSLNITSRPTVNSYRNFEEPCCHLRVANHRHLDKA